MPRFVKDDAVVETAHPASIVKLRSQGFTEQKAKTAAVREADKQNDK